LSAGVLLGQDLIGQVDVGRRSEERLNASS
jgi:hypothetical protein